MATQSSTTPAACITLSAPQIYDEVLAIIPRRLYGTSAIGPTEMPAHKFFLDVIDSYIPTLLDDIRGYCAGDDNRDALALGEAAVANLRQTMATLRGLPTEAYRLVDPGYAAVIEAFAAAHDQEFRREGDCFADDFAAWKRGA